MTNLDVAKKYFKKAYFEHDDRYVLDNEYSIQHLEGEMFTVDRNWYDSDVGYVTDDEIFTGDFKQCLEYCLGEKLNSDDIKTLNNLK